MDNLLEDDEEKDDEHISKLWQIIMSEVEKTEE